MTNSILHGIRIVDMTSGLAGPMATHLLAEVGADVIKVESPRGDPMRGSSAFATWNRSKRSIVLDLHDAGDRSTLDRLLAGADVLVHGLRPSTAVSHHLDDDSLATAFPHLIVSSVLGYPICHPDADRPGYDILVQARSGAMDEMVASRGGPMFLRLPAPSWSACYLASAGIVGRLLLRARTGRAGPVHTSLHQGMLAYLMLLWHDGDRITPDMKTKSALTKESPGPGLLTFLCADERWMQFGSFGFVETPLLLETLAEMGEYVEFDTWTPPPEVLSAYRRAFARRPLDEWLDALRAHDVAVEPVQPLGSVFRDRQVIANEYVIDLDHPQFGRVRQTLAPYRCEPAPRVRCPAPSLDGDRNAIIVQAWPAPTIAGSEPYPARLLEGIKVLDLGMFLAGPFAPMLMGDLGADVIKVEPLTGDRMRMKDQQRMFVGCHRGKRSIALDLRNPESRQVLERLVRWADVVHHNLRMPAARKLGIDDESLRTMNPSVISCHVSSYGHTGDKANTPGYDPTGQAASGWQFESAPAGCKPVWYRFAPMDFMCALASLLPTMLGLYQRQRTGAASSVTASLLGSAVQTNSETMLLVDTDSLAPYAHLDDLQTGTSAGYRIYATADRCWVAVAALGDLRRAALRRVAGVESDAGLVAALESWTSSDVLAALDAAGVPAELVRLDEERDFFDRELDQPSRLAVSYPHPVYGNFVQPGAFWNLGDLELSLQVAPPLLGEHTREILRHVGFDDELVDRLIETGVVASPNVPYVQ